jgi:hypothetical protein
MRAPPGLELNAPEFPPELEWMNVAFLRMAKQIRRHAVLVEFWDFARVNSLRTLPYIKAWHERYADAGLRVITVQAPGYSFGRDMEVARAAIEKLGLENPVAFDTDFKLWRTYGNKGWPGRYLFDRRGLLRYIHYGEGDYLECEEVIRELLAEIEDQPELPDPIGTLRPEDEPGAVFEPQTADIVLPSERDRLELIRDWHDGEDFIEAQDAGAGALFDFKGSSAWAVLSGSVEPGLYEVEDGRIEAESPGLRLHGIQFTP